MPQEIFQSKDQQRTDLREPRQFKVTIVNDDFTTMDFVVEVLIKVFFFSSEKAYDTMMRVHRIGRSVVGVYSYDVALSKVNKATDMARENGFPLRFEVDPEDE